MPGSVLEHYAEVERASMSGRQSIGAGGSTAPLPAAFFPLACGPEQEARGAAAAGTLPSNWEGMYYVDPVGRQRRVYCNHACQTTSWARPTTVASDRRAAEWLESALDPEEPAGGYGGADDGDLGLELRRSGGNGGALRVAIVIDGGPADEAASATAVGGMAGMIRVEDAVVSIDGVDVRHAEAAAATRLLRGPPGSPVVLGIVRGGIGAPAELAAVRYVWLRRRVGPDAGRPPRRIAVDIGRTVIHMIRQDLPPPTSLAAAAAAAIAAASPSNASSLAPISSAAVGIMATLAPLNRIEQRRGLVRQRRARVCIPAPKFLVGFVLFGASLLQSTCSSFLNLPRSLYLALSGISFSLPPPCPRPSPFSPPLPLVLPLFSRPFLLLDSHGSLQPFHLSSQILSSRLLYKFL